MADWRVKMGGLYIFVICVSFLKDIAMFRGVLENRKGW
jgi:hypothetical protein